MESLPEWGAWSLAPLIIALAAAFWTRSAAFSLLLGALVGVMMLGSDPAHGLNTLFQEALGSANFIWICEIVLLIGIFFELLKHSGVLSSMARKVPQRITTRKGVALTTWGMGLVIIDDYFSPLMSGSIMRPLADKAGMPREKLAFLLDSTTASVCILFPFAAWAAYFSGLLVAQGGPIHSPDIAVSAFIHAIPYNFYPILMLLFALLIALNRIPDFGPMAKAERRARETGQLFRPGANPLFDSDTLSDPSLSDEQAASAAPVLWLQLALPVLILFATIAAGIVLSGSVWIVEAFMAAVTFLALTLLLRKQLSGVADLVDHAFSGARSVVPALIIIALAYAINHITTQLGAAEYLIHISHDFMTPQLLVASVFLVSALISFSTGTSWGTYALMIPLVVPLAYAYNDASLDPLLYKTIAAIAGGGIFGDHASPVSDTSVLSSAGAGSDHMDHVITQLPYALVVAAVALLLYLVI